MTDVILTEEQARLLREAEGEVALRTAEGAIVGFASRVAGEVECAITSEELSPEVESAYVRFLRERSRQPGRSYTTAEVLEHLRSLEDRGL